MDVKNLLKKYKIQPLKWLGQNFLIDKEVVKKVIEAADLKPGDAILEIGPGIGALTLELAKKAKRIVAIEKDPNMSEILNNELRITGIKNVEIIQGDILKINPQASNLPYLSADRKPKTYKIVANLPFYLTAPVIRKFLEMVEIRPLSPKPQRKGEKKIYLLRSMVLIVQKEMGQRICAKPPDMNLLAVSIQFYAEPEIVSYISKESFWPRPKIDGAIIKIVPHKAAPHRPALLEKGGAGAGFREQFFKIVKAGFSQPRKQLINNLAKGLKIDKNKIRAWLSKNKIKPEQRAQTLEIKDWLNLTKSYNIK